MQSNPEKRFLDPSMKEERATSVRPKNLVDFIGQSSIKDNLSVFIEAAKNRSESMDHLLLYSFTPYAIGTSVSNIPLNKTSITSVPPCEI